MAAERAPFAVTIYHNPACGTSRNVLAHIRAAGIEPEIIEYLERPPNAATLADLIRRMGIRPRALLREKNTPRYAELGLGDDRFTDEELIGIMCREPVVMNRPIVVTPYATRLCRPSETVLAILPAPDPAGRA